MSIGDLVKLDSLWRRTFPYLAAQIMEGYQRDSGSVLELGPFSGGKTTLMSALARELALAGEAVITTTTTKIFEPSASETFLILEPDEKKMLA